MTYVWRTTRGGITKSQRELLTTMTRVPYVTTNTVAKARGIYETSARQLLTALRKVGMVNFKRKGNVGVWSVDEESALGYLWPLLASEEGHKRGLPVNTPSMQGRKSKVEERRDRMVAFLEENPARTRAQIVNRFPSCNENDFAALRSAGRIHATWVKRVGYRGKTVGDRKYFPGPKEASQ